MTITTPTRECSTSGTLLLVGGPSGIGKTETVNRMIGLYPGTYYRPKSFTSRPRRQGETDEEYEFTSDTKVRSSVTSGIALHIDEVYGNLYSIEVASIDRILQRGQHAIKEVHPRFHSKFRTRYPDLISIVLLPANELALKARNLENDSDRSVEDAEVFSNLSLDEYDLVYYVSMGETPDMVTSFLHEAIGSILESDADFPRPTLIDRTNAEGYSRVSAEFTDENRPTTACFHEATRPFWSTVANEARTERCKILEIGPGRNWLRRNFDWTGVEYYAAEVSSQMVDYVDERVVVASARALPFERNAFDMILGALADPYLYPAALLEIKRVLKNGGRFFMTTPAREWSQHVRQQQQSNQTTFTLSNGPATVYSFTYYADDLTRLLEQAGFVDIVQQPVLVGAIPNPAPHIVAASQIHEDRVTLPIIHTIEARKPLGGDL